MSCCRRCCKPIIDPYEYEIRDGDLLIPSNLKKFILPIKESDIQLLKDKTICDMQNIIAQLERGIQPNLEILLEQISAITLEQEIERREFIIQFYLNKII